MKPEPDREGDIDPVEQELDEQPQIRLAPAEEIAEDRIIGERCGRGQKPDADIGLHRLGHLRLRPHEPFAGDGNQRRKQDDADAQDDRYRERPPEDGPLFQVIAAPERLRHQAGGS
jgi:hypothetical protein